MVAERRESDLFLLSVVKDCILLWEATIIMTSRPHACENQEIQEFKEKPFPNNVKCTCRGCFHSS